VELEDGNQYGSEQTGGNELVRLLGQVGFGKVHVEYFLPNIEPINYKATYPGILMIRGSQKLYRIRREDLLNIAHGILFEHYLPWYRGFFGDQSTSYKGYLDRLFRDFANRLGNQPTVTVNGPETDSLIVNPTTLPTKPGPHSVEFRVGLYIAMFAAVAAIACGALYELKTPPSLTVPTLLGLVALFGGIVAISSGRAIEVFEGIIQLLRDGKRKLHYQQSPLTPEDSEAARPRLKSKKKDSEIVTSDKSD
jgi:hypothetical protein